MKQAISVKDCVGEHQWKLVGVRRRRLINCGYRMKDNRWYQIDANTGMKTGWHFDEAGDKHWYYPVSGEMLTGCRQIDGNGTILQK